MPQISAPKRLGQSRVQCTVIASEEEVKKAEAAALGRIAGEVRVPGFRPGKAPADMVKSQVREEALLEETIRSMLPQVIDSILKEHALQPILPPRIALEAKNPLTLVVTFIEKPEVTVKKIDTSSFKKTEPKFDEKDVERMVKYLLDQYRTTEVVDRAAEEGDQVTMSFVGTDSDGKEIEGTRAAEYQVVLGSNSLIPGFESGLKGLKKGDKKDLALTFPEKYHAEKLQGKPVNFAVEVQKVEKVTLPTLTPEFVKEKGLGDSPEDVRKRITDSMREEENRMDQQRREQLLFDAIRKATKIDIAPELLDQDVRSLLEDLQRRLESQKQTLEDWMQKSNKTPEIVEKELKEEAEKRITLRFGVQKLIEDQKIELTPEEEKQAADERLAAIPEDQRSSAAAYFAKGGEGYEELVWGKKVEKLVKTMLA